MDKFKKMFWYLLICAAAFYVLPLLGKDTGSFMLILLMLIPLICFIASLFYGVKNGFNFIFSLIVGVLFIPTIFLYYNSSAWVYILAYTVISMVGNLIGGFFVKSTS
jgi:uncharacterized membrane protein